MTCVSCIAVSANKFVEGRFDAGDSNGVGCACAGRFGFGSVGVLLLNVSIVILGTVIQLTQKSFTVSGSPVKNWKMSSVSN
jgi:hypothetical protein